MHFALLTHGDKMDIKTSGFSTEKITKKDVPFLIGLFSLGLFLFFIWTMPLIDPDEPRYAATARDMVLHGNWIVPHFNGVPRINKPPLFYWTIAISYKIFGINEFSSRLPSALSAIGTVMITYLWGKRFINRRKGFWAGVVLMTSPLFFFISRFCITDMLLTFLVSASLYLFFVEYMETNKRWKDGFKTRPYRIMFLYFLLAMVFLVKGPIGILLFILITLCFLLWIREFSYIRRLWYLPGFILFLGIICSWGIPFWLSLGTQQIFTLLSQETAGRFVSGYAHPEPFYYYLPVFMMGFFPWSLFVCISLAYIFMNRKKMPLEEKKQAYFFCSWFILTLVFFSLSHSKLMTYILPLSPSVALLTLFLSRWETEDKLWNGFKISLWFTLALLTVLPIVLLITMPRWTPLKYGLSTYHMIIPIVILFIGTLIALFFFLTTKCFSPVQKVFCFTNCLFLIITIGYLSKYIGIFRSAKDIVEKSSLNKIADYTLLSYSGLAPSLVFYSSKEVQEIEFDAQFKSLIADQTKPVYIMMSLNDYQKKNNWVKKENFQKVYQNSAHIMLKKGNN